MSKKPRLILPAEQEMYDAARYYELQAPGLGNDFLDKIELALKDISSSPERWPIVHKTFDVVSCIASRIRCFIVPILPKL